MLAPSVIGAYFVQKRHKNQRLCVSCFKAETMKFMSLRKLAPRKDNFPFLMKFGLCVQCK